MFQAQGKWLRRLSAKPAFRDVLGAFAGAAAYACLAGVWVAPHPVQQVAGKPGPVPQEVRPGPDLQVALNAGDSSNAVPIRPPGPQKQKPRKQAAEQGLKGAYQVGIASYHGHRFHGRPTASGEIQDMNGFTAAHRHLPIGTILRVTNLRNGRRVVVRVNDRGPFVKGRILDLSLGAARGLGMVRQGLARVKIEIVAPAQKPHQEDKTVPL